MNAVSKIDEKDAAKLDMEQPTPAAQPAIAAPPPVETLAVPQKKKSRGLRFFLMVSVPLILVAAGGYYYVTGGRYEETENANLQQATLSIAANVPGRIVEVNVADNKPVRKGDVLFAVDPEPYKIALAQADAAVANARLGVEQLRSAYRQAQAKELSASSEVTYAQSQYDRAVDLVKKGINPQSTLDQARNDLDKAKQDLSVAVQGIDSAKAALDGNPDIATDQHPTVLAAFAARDKAAFDLSQATVRAPDDGVAYKAASFRVGQYVGVGTPLFALVETGDTWIDANFKETQLTRMKPGQKAEVVLDTYPDKTFEATVQAIGAGTGAQFSLLPAQNATGNWVKVTQRIPVRLQLDDKDAELALRAGMSASVTVDTGVSRGFGGLFGKAFAGEAK
ncbi:MAG: HlyD family secretion protein [Aquamicrobium sp.]|uniref:HlyD family secretion protein n=1 Tax=Mesorhizobium sp. Pch-S TaxID=2082387 RepID=UPI0010117B93|nr:HlyD family secretion protein [Mesorhizobium sp. Pch-S]MBR2691530.1 HlyD family secretion protein [Aquamicrobium sp.]QAZ45780.1 HlyD family secretion protein [Mesorhizobium sp. Pch-S]